MINLLYWALGVCIVLCILLFILRKTDTVVRVGKRKITVILTIIVAVVCIAPVIMETAKGLSPKAYYEYVMADIRVSDTDNIHTIENFSDDIVAEQKFVCDGYICQIKLLTKTVEDNYTGEVEIELLNGNNKLIQSWLVGPSDITEDKYVELNIENPFELDLDGQICTIRVTPDSGKGYVNYSFAIEMNQYAGGELLINGEQTGCDMVMQLTGYENETVKEDVRVWICLFIFIGAALLIYKSLWIEGYDKEISK